MATTIALLRTNHLNRLLHRLDGTTEPWSDTACNGHLQAAMDRLWPDLGTPVAADVTASYSAQLYSVPTIKRVTHIDLMNSNGRYIDRVSDWRTHSATAILIPHIVFGSGYTLRFYGWAAFARDASDLPVRLESVVAERAASLAYGELAGGLVNYQRQQTTESGRVVSYGDAAGLSAYWERRYRDAVLHDEAAPTSGPRRYGS